MISHPPSAGYIVVVLALVGLSCRVGIPPATRVTGSTDRISFQTLNLSAGQFVAGSKEGPSVTIFGDLLIPRDHRRVPAVILIHGSAGVTGAERGWAAHLPRIGIATFMVDSFSPRGITGAPAEEKLNRAALAVAARLLLPGGFLLVKSFVSDELQTFTLELKKIFSAVQRTRPEATRQGSSELFLLAKGFDATIGAAI